MALLMLPLSAQLTQADDPTVLFVDDDPELNVAIQEARRDLDTFLKYARKSKLPHAYNVRITLHSSKDDTVEYLWVFAPKRKFGIEEVYVANINEQPKLREHRVFSNMIEFHYNQITDWAVVKNGQNFGNYSGRIFTMRDPKYAKHFDVYYSKNPVPGSGDWP
ncbi:DUF2314 domain-containing protein [Roseovarius aestuarii]